MDLFVIFTVSRLHYVEFLDLQMAKEKVKIKHICYFNENCGYRLLLKINKNVPEFNGSHVLEKQIRNRILLECLV